MPSAFTTSSSVAIGLLQRKKDFFGDIWHFHTCYYKRQLGDNWSHDSKKYGITTLCLKITEKVAFNIASEASYVYILSGQKPKMVNLASFWKPEACGQVLPDRSLLKGQKLVENAKISIFVLLNHPSQTFLFGKNESSWLVYKWLLSPTRKRRGFLKNF